MIAGITLMQILVELCQHAYGTQSNRNATQTLAFLTLMKQLVRVETNASGIQLLQSVLMIHAAYLEVRAHVQLTQNVSGHFQHPNVRQTYVQSTLIKQHVETIQSAHGMDLTASQKFAKRSSYKTLALLRADAIGQTQLAQQIHVFQTLIKHHAMQIANAHGQELNAKLMLVLLMLMMQLVLVALFVNGTVQNVLQTHALTSQLVQLVGLTLHANG